MSRKEILNNDLSKMKKDIVENYHHLEYVSTHSSYHELQDLLPKGCCTMKYPYRSIYDQYWSTFYCKKAMNTDTDLLSIQFT